MATSSTCTTTLMVREPSLHWLERIAMMHTHQHCQVLKIHNINEAIPQSCRQDNSESLWRCFVGPVSTVSNPYRWHLSCFTILICLQFIYNYVETPIYVANSQYDSVILEGVYLLPCTPPECTAEGTAFLRDFKAAFDRQVEPVLSSPSQNGYFLDSCYIHCQTFESDITWSEISIGGVTMAQSFGDWYFERSGSSTRLKDCDTDFPCNPTCFNPDSSLSRATGNATRLQLLTHRHPFLV